MPSVHTTRQWLVSAGLLLAVAGCSSTDTFEEPVPVPEVVDTVELDEVWSRQVGDGHDGKFLYLAPLIADTSIYAASADGEIAAFAAADGKRQWERDLDVTLMAGVGGDAESLYVVTEDAELTALSRIDGSDRWQAELPNEAIAAPRSNGGLVVVQTIDGKVHGFDAATGEKRWQYDGAVPVLSLRAAASPLVGQELVLASLPNGRLMALSTDSGRPIWQYQVGEPKGRTELDRLVDIAGEPLILDSAALVVGYNGKLALVNIQNGAEIWSKPASSLYSPMISQGNIFYASSNGDIVGLNGSDRKEIWKQSGLAWRQPTQPMVIGDYLAVGDFEGYIHLLSQQDGSFQGQIEFDDEGLRVPFRRLPDGRLMVFGNDGELAVFELESLE